MKKDLRSYREHDKEYDILIENKKTIEIVREVEDLNHFKNLGFEYALKMFSPLPKLHIDIGSGAGWLAKKTSPSFQKVIGIEPSVSAIKIANELNKENGNVSFLSTDMIDGLKEINSTESVFITTGTVLNHIEDFYVKDFLKLVNTLPLNSVVFFDERYDVNVSWKLWHVRNKDWWIDNLDRFQLFFFNIEASIYPTGIYGLCVGKENVIKQKRLDTFEKIIWKISLPLNIFKRILNKILGK